MVANTFRNAFLGNACLCTALLALAGSPALAQTGQTIQEKRDALDALVPTLLARHDVPSVGLAYIEDGEIAFVRHYGYQSWGFPANEQTLYNVASLTKPVTAETVLRLVNAGRFSLDAPLADYHIEEDVADDPRIQALTARLVMHHRTGFPNWRYLTEGTLRFVNDPDTEVGYSGEGYEWMLKAVEAASEEPFETLASEMVFKPEGMTQTGYTFTRAWWGHMAVPYKAGEAVPNVFQLEPVASDDMRTTAREYARFMVSVFEGDAVSETLREEQFTISETVRYRPACRGENPAAFCPKRQGWGLGWTIYEWDDRRVVEHSGGDHGEKTLAFYDPEARRGVVVLTNGANGFEVIKPVAALLDGDERFAEFVDAPFG